MDFTFDFVISFRDKNISIHEMVNNCQSVANDISNIEISFWGNESSFQDRDIHSMNFNIILSLKESNIAFLNSLKDNFHENSSQKYLNQSLVSVEENQINHMVYEELCSDYDDIEELLFSYYIYYHFNSNQVVDYIYLRSTSSSHEEMIKLFLGIDNFIKLLFLLFEKSNVIIHIPYINLREILQVDYSKVEYLIGNLNEMTLESYGIPKDCIYYINNYLDR